MDPDLLMPPLPLEKTFTSLEEAKTFCHDHALHHDLALRDQSNNLSSQKSISLACDRAGTGRRKGQGIRNVSLVRKVAK